MTDKDGSFYLGECWVRVGEDARGNSVQIDGTLYHETPGRREAARWLLRGQSFGFTHDDVEFLRLLAGNEENRAEAATRPLSDALHARAGVLLDLASRIAALVSPGDHDD